MHMQRTENALKMTFYIIALKKFKVLKSHDMVLVF